MVAAQSARSRARRRLVGETAATTTRARRRRRRAAVASPPASFQRSSSSAPAVRVADTQDAAAAGAPRTYSARAPAPRRVHRCDMTLLVTIHPPRRHIAETSTTSSKHERPRECARPPARARALSLSRPTEREGARETRINTTGVDRPTWRGQGRKPTWREGD